MLAMGPGLCRFDRLELHVWVASYILQVLSSELNNADYADVKISVVRLPSKLGIERVQTCTRWNFVFALCCHSNATCTPIANPPNSAQPGASPNTLQVTSGSMQ